MNPVKQSIYNVISAIQPIDQTEKQDIENTLMWIQSGSPIYRVYKPHIPDSHLCAYFVVFDSTQHRILLLDHIHAQRWLPPGGHLEINESLEEAVQRECQEELNVSLPFWSKYPCFIAPTSTVGYTAGHVDVNVWYVLKGDMTWTYDYDAEECRTYTWFHLDEVPIDQTDPHMPRFLQKMKTMLAE